MKPNLICYLISALLLLLPCTRVMSASWQITYPRMSSEADRSTDYPVKVLAMALEQTGVNFKLLPSEKYYPQGKNLSRLKDNREINVVWSMTDAQREKDLLPIRIPIYKGLVGWRLLLIREDMAERFKYIQTLDHLLKLLPIQGSDWPDTKILQANSFDVVTNINHSVLGQMLSNAQGDFFPRSMLEIWDEIDTLQTDNKIIVQDSLGLQYPAAMYFFVNNQNRPLAHLIKTGLEKAIKNGKFEQLFNKTYRSYIDKTKLKKRKFYQLKNTFLPPETPIERKELWFNPN